jgi:aminoglycoside phosphotransferase
VKKNIVFVYDNRNDLSSAITKIVALNSYGDIIYKRQKIQSIVKDIVLTNFSNIEYIFLNKRKDVEKLIEYLEKNSNNIYIHFYSSTVITDVEQFKIFIQKTIYIQEKMIVNKSNPTSIVFNNSLDYKKFIQNDLLISPNNINDEYPDIQELAIDDCLKNISIYDNFLKFFSGGFEARHFNSVTGNEYIVTKSSTNKAKIKAEHDYYYLIPDSMKSWFVTPFNYYEDKDRAYYSMERIATPDVALQWVHEAISVESFEILLDKLMFFINSRPSKECTENEYINLQEKIYIDKVQDRINELKNMKEYDKIRNILQLQNNYNSIDQVYDEYIKLYEKIVLNKKSSYIKVIGHGDLCFSNILYYKDINLLKFIDVKGATNNDDLWTDAYYDLAKLSHSICGNYDFFNYDMVDIRLDKDCNINFEIEKRDTSQFIDVFKKKLIENGYDYIYVRVLEISLFISMLPLHMDNPNKVLGFILNAINIIEEVKKYGK